MASRLPARERLDSYRALISRAVPLADVLADTAGMHLEVTGPDEPEIICSLPVTCPADNRELIRRHIDIPADLIGMLDAAAKRDAERRREIEKLRQALEAKGGRPAKDYAAECAMKCAEPAIHPVPDREARPAASRNGQDGCDARAVGSVDRQPEPVEHRPRHCGSMAGNGQ